jgi:serine/threonine protein phosphatase 1
LHFIRSNHDELLLHGSKTLKTIRCGINMGRSNGFSIWRGWKHKAAAHQLLIIIRRLSSKRTVFVHAVTNMNGVKYEFYQNYFIGIELETALALDRNIKPNDLLYPKQLNFIRWGLHGTYTCNKNRVEPLQMVVSGIWIPERLLKDLWLLWTSTKEFWQSEPLNTFFDEKEEIRNK